MCGGTYGLVVMHPKEPGKLVAARLGSPAGSGVGNGQILYCFRHLAHAGLRPKVVFFDDGGKLPKCTETHFYSFGHSRTKKLTKPAEQIDWDEASAQNRAMGILC